MCDSEWILASSDIPFSIELGDDLPAASVDDDIDDDVIPRGKLDDFNVSS